MSARHAPCINRNVHSLRIHVRGRDELRRGRVLMLPNGGSSSPSKFGQDHVLTPFRSTAQPPPAKTNTRPEEQTGRSEAELMQQARMEILHTRALSLGRCVVHKQELRSGNILWLC